MKLFQSTPKKRRIALVIGNGNYQDLPPLTNPPKDVELMSERLRELEFEVNDFNDAIRGLSTTVDLDQESMDLAINAFLDEALKADVCLLFFAGHGLQIDGDNYLIAVDTKLYHISIRENIKSLQSYLTKLNALDKTTKEPLFKGEFFMFLDACRTTSASGNAAGGASPEELSGVGIFDSEGIQEIPDRSYLAFATAPGQVSWDGDEEDNGSFFTEALHTHIHTNNLDIGSMMQRVRNQVLDRQDQLVKQGAWDRADRRKWLQIPWTVSTLRGRFDFRPVSYDFMWRLLAWSSLGLLYLLLVLISTRLQIDILHNILDPQFLHAILPKELFHPVIFTSNLIFSLAFSIVLLSGLGQSIGLYKYLYLCSIFLYLLIILNISDYIVFYLLPDLLEKLAPNENQQICKCELGFTYIYASWIIGSTVTLFIVFLSSIFYSPAFIRTSKWISAVVISASLSVTAAALHYGNEYLYSAAVLQFSILLTLKTSYYLILPLFFGKTICEFTPNYNMR